jgi:DNA polymerase I-like protein with 3'-5' exonuclease and polymerase domains
MLASESNPTTVLATVKEEYSACLGWSPSYKQEGITSIMQKILHEVEVASGVTLDRTPSGQIATNEEALSKYDVDSPFLVAYKEYKHLEKMIGTYLDSNKIMSDGRIHPRYQALVRTGRTSCRGPNHQNV